MQASLDLITKVETLQNILISRATGGSPGGEEYVQLRRELIAEDSIRDKLPRFVRTCGDLYQFWTFIKNEFSSYQERRDYLWNQFRPLLEELEGVGVAPSDKAVSEVLAEFDADHVHVVWGRAIERRLTDPEGAITLARTLLETVCKHILDELRVPYEDSWDLPKLYKTTAEQLQLSPSQHTEQTMKQILGGCFAVVEGLGALRNKIGDAHGGGKSNVKPSSRHAELAVNLAGTTATFLVRTWEEHTLDVSG